MGEVKCCDCHGPLGAMFVGAGDGRGRRFRCESCFHTHEKAALRARLAAAEGLLREVLGYDADLDDDGDGLTEADLHDRIAAFLGR